DDRGLPIRHLDDRLASALDVRYVNNLAGVIQPADFKAAILHLDREVRHLVAELGDRLDSVGLGPGRSLREEPQAHGTCQKLGPLHPGTFLLFSRASRFFWAAAAIRGGFVFPTANRGRRGRCWPL